MTTRKRSEFDAGRRQALKLIGTGAVAASAGASLFGSATGEVAAASAPGAATAKAPVPYNILFILTDQERHFRPGELPRDYRLPAHERLAKKGVVFENHQINSCVCTPSRSVLYTGQLEAERTGDVVLLGGREGPVEQRRLREVVVEAGRAELHLRS